MAPPSPAGTASSSHNASDGGFHDAYNLLVKLCSLGARPPIIRTLLPAVIKKPMVYSTFRRICGRPAPQGQLPQSVGVCLESPSLRLHTTCVLFLHRELSSLPVEQRYIRVHEAYLALVGQEWLLDFNRIYFLGLSFKTGSVILVKCLRCSTHFASNYAEVTDAKNCPVCAVMKHPASPESWTAADLVWDRQQAARRDRGRLAREPTANMPAIRSLRV